MEDKRAGKWWVEAGDLLENVSTTGINQGACANFEQGRKETQLIHIDIMEYLLHLRGLHV